MNNEQNQTNEKKESNNVYTAKVGGVSATVFNNMKTINGSDVNIQTISLQRSYKDAQGEWKHTTNLGVNDIPKAKLALSKAYEYVVLRESGE